MYYLVIDMYRLYDFLFANVHVSVRISNKRVGNVDFKFVICVNDISSSENRKLIK